MKTQYVAKKNGISIVCQTCHDMAHTLGVSDSYVRDYSAKHQKVQGWAIDRYIRKFDLYEDGQLRCKDIDIKELQYQLRISRVWLDCILTDKEGKYNNIEIVTKWVLDD